MLDKITKLALISLALTGCATGPSQTATSVPQGPADWSYVGGDSAGNLYFIDYGTIRRDGDYAKVAQKHIWKTPEIFCEAKSPARSALFVGEYNCRTEHTRSLFSAAYSGAELDGELVVGRTASGPWERVVPDSVGGSILEAVCNYAPEPWQRVRTPSHVQNQVSERPRRAGQRPPRQSALHRNC